MTDTTEQKGKITLGLITSWGLGSIFLLAGVLSLFDPAASSVAIPFILIAVVLFPPIRQFVHQRTGKSISTGLRVVSVLILFVIASINLSESEGLVSGDAETSANIETVGALTKATPEVTSKDGLVIENFALHMDEYGVGKVVGTLKNNTKKQYSYVQVEFNLYDDSGAQVGSTMANVNNLEPSGYWSFEAPVLEGRTTQAKLKGVTKF